MHRVCRKKSKQKNLCRKKSVDEIIHFIIRYYYALIVHCLHQKHWAADWILDSLTTWLVADNVCHAPGEDKGFTIRENLWQAWQAKYLVSSLSHSHGGAKQFSSLLWNGYSIRIKYSFFIHPICILSIFCIRDITMFWCDICRVTFLTTPPLFEHIYKYLTSPLGAWRHLWTASYTKDTHAHTILTAYTFKEESQGSSMASLTTRRAPYNLPLPSMTAQSILYRRLQDPLPSYRSHFQLGHPWPPFDLTSFTSIYIHHAFLKNKDWLYESMLEGPAIRMVRWMCDPSEREENQSI